MRAVDRRSHAHLIAPLQAFTESLGFTVLFESGLPSCLGPARARQRFSIRHTEQISRRVHEARRVLELSIDYYEQFKTTGNQLASERCSERQLQAVLDELYPSGTEDSMTDRTRRGWEQVKERIADLFLRGDTQGNAPGEQVGGGQRDR